MSQIYNHADYNNTLTIFQEQVSNAECTYVDWSLFKSIHLDITKNRCPICEVLLDGSESRMSNSGTTVIRATMDHFRPKLHYPFLKCNDKNYIVMCSECNNRYKDNLFPLYPFGTSYGTEFTYQMEQPLIVNPIFDKVIELFKLVFRRSSTNSRKILELKPKEGLNEYERLKAEETIKVFGLGECEENRHSLPNVHECRMRLLEKHFDKLDVLAKVRKVGLDDFLEFLDENPDYYDYGFTKFIANEQFEYFIV